MPRPPECCGSAAVIPSSGEKYATVADAPPSSGAVWYQRGPELYSRRSSTASPSRRRNRRSSARLARRSGGTSASSAAGSRPSPPPPARAIAPHTFGASGWPDHGQGPRTPRSRAQGLGRAGAGQGARGRGGDGGGGAGHVVPGTHLAGSRTDAVTTAWTEERGDERGGKAAP